MSGAVRKSVLMGVWILALAFILAGCGGGGEEKKEGGGGGEEEKKEGGGETTKGGDTKGGDTKAAAGGGGSPGQVAVEGSSTVLPITQAAAEGFQQQNPDVRITVGGAGTGDGFEAFCSGETQIADASRPINDEEIQACEQNGISFLELAVAQDGIAVVVNPQNTVSDITLEQLGQLFAPDAEGQIQNFSDLDPSFPSQPLSLYGPGTESGTFEFFTEKAVGKKKEQRTDYQASEDDNVLVQGVSGDPNGLGYFGFGYYAQNQQALKALNVDGVAPTQETINSGEYPLARPLFIYVSTQALEDNSTVEQFVTYYLDNLEGFVTAANYVPLSQPAAQETQERFQNRTAGSAPEDAGGEGKAKGAEGKQAKEQQEAEKKEKTK